MTFGCFAFALFLDSWFDSPFIIPVAGCAMGGCIAVAGIWSGVRTREMKAQERLALIAQGIPLDSGWDQSVTRQASAAAPAPMPAPPSNGAGARRAGLVLSSLGVGLMVFFAFLAIVLRVREVLSGAAAGILPLAIGIGFLVDARLRQKEFERWMARFASSMAPAEPTRGADSFATAPAAPEGMTPAQASDWRPLH